MVDRAPHPAVPATFSRGEGESAPAWSRDGRRPRGAPTLLATGEQARDVLVVFRGPPIPPGVPAPAFLPVAAAVDDPEVVQVLGPPSAPGTDVLQGRPLARPSVEGDRPVADQALADPVRPRSVKVASVAATCASFSGVVMRRRASGSWGGSVGSDSALWHGEAHSRPGYQQSSGLGHGASRRPEEAETQRPHLTGSRRDLGSS